MFDISRWTAVRWVLTRLDAFMDFIWPVSLETRLGRFFGSPWVRLPSVGLLAIAMIFSVVYTFDSMVLKTGVVEMHVRQFGYEYQVIPRKDAPRDVRPSRGYGDFTLIQTEPAPTSDPSLQVYHVLFLGDREFGDRLRAIKDQTGRWPVVTVMTIEYDMPYTMVFHQNKPRPAATAVRGFVTVNGEEYVVRDIHVWTTRTEPILVQLPEEDAPQGASSPY